MKLRIALLSAAAIYLLPFATPAYAELGALLGVRNVARSRSLRRLDAFL